MSSDSNVDSFKKIMQSLLDSSMVVINFTLKKDLSGTLVGAIEKASDAVKNINAEFVKPSVDIDFEEFMSQFSGHMHQNSQAFMEMMKIFNSDHIPENDALDVVVPKDIIRSAVKCCDVLTDFAVKPNSQAAQNLKSAFNEIFEGADLIPNDGAMKLNDIEFYRMLSDYKSKIFIYAISVEDYFNMPFEDFADALNSSHDNAPSFH